MPPFVVLLLEVIEKGIENMAKTITRTATISNKAIIKRFNSHKPFEVVSEYVWNGIDAKANDVNIKLYFYDDELQTVDKIDIIDNGDGIDFQNPDTNFDQWDSSLKDSFDEKGSQGRGRFSFHKIATQATWFTCHHDEHAIISAFSQKIPDYSITPIAASEQNSNVLKNKKGTCVSLTNITKKQAEKIPKVEQLLKEFSLEFGWKLIIDNKLSIKVNSIDIKPPKHRLHTFDKEIDGHNFSISLIIWDEKPNKEKSYNYYYNSEIRYVYNDLTGLNYKNGFYLSAYITSSWFNNFNTSTNRTLSLYDDNESSPNSEAFKKLKSFIQNESRRLYNEFIIEQADELVEDFENKGFIPTYKHEKEEEQRLRIKHTKNLIKSIHVADPYTFNGLKSNKHKKILVALLDKITVSNENDSLLEVLEGVLDLPQDKLDVLANQIKRTKLDHIISTIEVLVKRSDTIDKLQYLIEVFTKDTKETPDLQKIIENNFWLFGPQYELIGAEEDDFQKTSEGLLRAITNKDVIEIEDLVDSNLNVKNIRCQTDLFLARRMVSYSEEIGPHYRCTVIEIKRPSVALNQKHLGQIEKYAEVINKHTAFNDPNMTFDIILVGNKVSSDDYIIRQRLKDNRGKGHKGLVSGVESRIKCYVRSWAEIFNEFKITHTHLLDELKNQRIKLESPTKEELVEDLQSSS